MTTRRCTHCAREKSIRGVWYLTPASRGPAPFMCETCYAAAPGLLVS